MHYTNHATKLYNVSHKLKCAKGMFHLKKIWHTKTLQILFTIFKYFLYGSHLTGKYSITSKS